jgi:hypothetical protein
MLCELPEEVVLALSNVHAGVTAIYLPKGVADVKVNLDSTGGCSAGYPLGVAGIDEPKI